MRARAIGASRLHPHLELVLLTVEHRRCETQRVEAVQLLGHARERRRQVVGLLQLEIAAAGFFGELAQPAVRSASAAAARH